MSEQIASEGGIVVEATAAQVQKVDEARKGVSRRGFMGFLGGILGVAATGGVAAAASKLVGEPKLVTEGDWNEVKELAKKKTYFFPSGKGGWTFQAEGVEIYGDGLIHEKFVTLPRRLDVNKVCHIDIDDVGEAIKEQVSRYKAAGRKIPPMFDSGRKTEFDAPWGPPGLRWAGGRETTVFYRKGVEIYRGSAGSYSIGRPWEKR